MVMLAEHYDFVIGGDPDRDTIDFAILDAVTGRVHNQYSDAADGPPYRRIWLGTCAAHRAAASGRWSEPAASPPAWSP
jgi:hypothetical protein